MGEAFDKPNPQGLINLIESIASEPISKINVPLIYVGDTVADVLTIKNARKLYPSCNFLSFAVAPPHLHKENKLSIRRNYEKVLLNEGANLILKDTYEVISKISELIIK